MGQVIHKLSDDERAEIDELYKAMQRSETAKQAAEKQLADDVTLVNAFVVRIRRKYKCEPTDVLRIDGYFDIYRSTDGVVPLEETGHDLTPKLEA